MSGQAYCELSRVPPTPIADFHSRHPLQRHQQQTELLASLLATPSAAAECYAHHPPLASANDMAAFPTIALLRRLASHAARPAHTAVEAAASPPPPSLLLPAICAADLFAIAVVHAPPTSLASNQAAVACVRKEAAANLASLCRFEPSLLMTIVDSAVAQADALAANQECAAARPRAHLAPPISRPPRATHLAPISRHPSRAHLAPPISRHPSRATQLASTSRHPSCAPLLLLPLPTRTLSHFRVTRSALSPLRRLSLPPPLQLATLAHPPPPVAGNRTGCSR